MTQQRSRLVEIDGQFYVDDGFGLVKGEPVAPPNCGSSVRPPRPAGPASTQPTLHQPSYDKGYAQGCTRGYDRGHAIGYEQGHEQGRNARALWILICLLAGGFGLAISALLLTAGDLKGGLQ